MLAVPLLVLSATGSALQMGVVTALSVGVRLAVGLFAGAVADSIDRQRLITVVELLRFLAYAAIPTVWVLSGPNMGVIYAVTVVTATLGAVASAGEFGIVPRIVERDLLGLVNSRVIASNSLALIFGPMLGGFVCAAWSPVAAVALNALTFLVNGLAVAALRLRPLDRPGPSQQEPLKELLIGGLRHIWGQPVLRAVTLVMTIVATMLLAVNDVFVYLMSHELKMGDAEVGVFFGTIAIGAAVGAWLTPAIRARVGFGGCFLVGILLEGAGLLGASLTDSLPAIVACAFVYSFFQTVRFVVMLSVYQEITPEHLLGRVGMAFETVATSFAPFGVAVSTYLADAYGGRFALLVLGGTAILAAAIGALTPARARWPERDYAPTDTGAV